MTDPRMTERRPPIRFTTPAHLPGVELVSAAYRDRAFPTHSHPEFVVGAVVGGVETLQVGRAVHLASAGSVLLLHPHEAHANAAVAPDVLRYRVLYISSDAMAAWLPAMPAFAAPVCRRKPLFARVTSAHAALERQPGRLEQEAAFAALVAALSGLADARHGRGETTPDSSIDRAKSLIDDGFASDFSLGDLAAVAGLSRFHFLRSFKRATGLTPVAYRNQRRVAEARRLLRSGRTIAEIALEVGFADQSHLTRHFQRIVGTSPARYREQ